MELNLNGRINTVTLDEGELRIVAKLQYSSKERRMELIQKYIFVFEFIENPTEEERAVYEIRWLL